MTEQINITEKPEITKSESISTENAEILKFIEFDCECENRFLYSSPCLMAEIEDDEDFLKR